MSNRPWLSAYPPGVPSEIDTAGYTSLVQLLEVSFGKYADRTAYSTRDAKPAMTAAATRSP